MGATVAAVAMHGLLFLLLVATAKGSMFTGGNVGGDSSAVDVVPVSLAGTPGERAAAPKPEGELQQLLTQLRTDSSLVQVEPPKTDRKPSTRLDDLFAELDKAHADQSGSGGNAKEDRGGKGAGADKRASADQTRETKQPTEKSASASGGAASSGKLWGQIEPCWSKLPDRSAVPVTLEIALSPNGLIAKPPKIIRPSAEAPTENRLLSEARALEAVRACVPYRGADGGLTGGEYRVEFRASK